MTESFSVPFSSTPRRGRGRPKKKPNPFIFRASCANCAADCKSLSRLQRSMITDRAMCADYKFPENYNYTKGR